MAHFGRLLENQLGQFAGLVFGLIFWKSANFSVYTFCLYLSLIYGSQIPNDIGGLPLLPRD